MEKYLSKNSKKIGSTLIPLGLLGAFSTLYAFSSPLYPIAVFFIIIELIGVGFMVHHYRTNNLKSKLIAPMISALVIVFMLALYFTLAYPQSVA